MRDPSTGVPWRGLLQHLIHLFEGQAFRFRHQQIRVDEAGGAEAAPEEENFGFEVALVFANEVGGDYCDDLVSQC